MTLSFDPDQVRGFSNDVMTELDDVIRPWIARIRELMADADGEANYQVLGRSSSAGAYQIGANDYAGRSLGFALSANANDGMRWLGELETGLKALSLASAVFTEKLVAGDEVNAEDLGMATLPLGDGDRYAI